MIQHVEISCGSETTSLSPTGEGSHSSEVLDSLTDFYALHYMCLTTTENMVTDIQMGHASDLTHGL